MPTRNGKKRRTPKVETGVHIVRKNLRSGHRYYVYAWRGGPCIHREDGSYPVINQKLLTKVHRAYEKLQASYDGPRLDDLITSYTDSPEYTGLAKSTKTDYSRWLLRISQVFGQLPLEDFNHRRMRARIISWRSEWKDKPRSADLAGTVMSIVLGHGVDQGELDINVAAQIRKLHHVNKSESIWEAHHWDALMANNPPPQLVSALQLASLTGFRLGDLVEVSWENVSSSAIIIAQTRKRKTRAVVPIITELKQWLHEHKPKKPEGPILRNSRNLPWSASGLKGTFQKNKPKGFERTFHDLRGTYATKLILAGLTDSEAAYILGWSAKRVGEIRARYVNEERVILSLAERLSA